MPAGLPSAEALMGREAVSFFSIDTDVIQGHGYKFNEGALHALALQRPNWIQIRLTEVVQREVLAHRMEPVLKAVQELQSSIEKLQRLTDIDAERVKQVFAELNFVREAEARFRQEFEQFVARLNGSVLPLDGPALAREMFSRYFDVLPPFEARKDKKSEFPDAGALLVLEAYAAQHNTHGILISNDGGWQEYASQSERLYCVKSLDEFSALFESKGTNADVVKEKIVTTLSDPLSELSHLLMGEVENHVNGAFWTVDDVYSGYSLRVDAEVTGVSYRTHDFDPNSIRLWFVEHDPSMCTVELSVSVEVDLDVDLNFYQWDSIDHDEICVGSDSLERRVEIEVDVFLVCRGDLVGANVEDWIVSFEVSGGDYGVDVGEVNPDFGDPD